MKYFTEKKVEEIAIGLALAGIAGLLITLWFWAYQHTSLNVAFAFGVTLVVIGTLIHAFNIYRPGDNREDSDSVRINIDVIVDELPEEESVDLQDNDSDLWKYGQKCWDRMNKWSISILQNKLEKAEKDPKLKDDITLVVMDRLIKCNICKEKDQCSAYLEYIKFLEKD